MQNQESNKEIVFTLEDSLKAVEIEQREMEKAIEQHSKRAVFDTIGLYTAPVKITSTKLVKREYTSYKDIYITYKNISNKTIAAIRFKWFGLNAFNEAAEMGEYGLLKGFGSGFADDRLAPGKFDSGTWEIMSRDAKKVVLAWPYEVAFADGTNWKIQ